jgi:hypothetical protein
MHGRQEEIAAILLTSLCLFGLHAARAQNRGNLPESSKVGLYIGTEGVCFSPGGSDCGRTATVIKASGKQLDDLVRKLRRAGLFSEKSRELAIVKGTPPQSFTIAVITPAEARDFRFYHAEGASVPEKYLAIFESWPGARNVDLVKRFLALNRERR